MDMIEHRVRERAYFIWEAEGRIAGRAEAHWTQAAAELTAPSDETVAAKAPRAKAAPKAAAAKSPAKAPAKAKKATRSSETGIALH